MTSVLVAPPHHGEVIIRTADGKTVLLPAQTPVSSKDTELIKRDGARAALELAKMGQEEIGKYLEWSKSHPYGGYQAAVLKDLPKLTSADIQVEEAVILRGDSSPLTLIASRGGALPEKLRGDREQPLSDPEFAKVECQRGTLRRGGKQVDVWFFSVPIEMPDRSEMKGRAVLIVAEKAKE